MSVSQTSAPSAADLYAQLGLTRQPTARSSGNDLGMDSFLRLMTEQMKNQDPTKPMDSSAYLGQLAQFSSVKGLQQLDARMQGMMMMMGDQQALQVAGLIGHAAYIKTDTAALAEGGTVAGSVTAAAPGTITFQVKNADGEVVREFTAEASAAGPVDFAWDGLDAAGGAAPAGTYTISAKAGGADLEVALAARIQSVSFTPDGIVLNLEGHDGVTFDQLLRIG